MVFPQHAHSGKTTGPTIVFAASIVVVVTLLMLLRIDRGGSAAPGKRLLVFCAAALKAPMEAASKQFEEEAGVGVDLQFGGSQTLLASIQASRKGDLYVPADDSYVRVAAEKGLSIESFPLVRMTLVIGVSRGNPKRIRALDDLLRPDVRLAQANPDAAAVGKVTRTLLEKTGQWTALESKTAVFKPTVNDVANDIKLGAVDAGFLWDALARQYPELEIVRVPLFEKAQAIIPAVVLRTSVAPENARRFAQFLTGPGLKNFERLGYQPAK